jgi:hypothetical protein
MEDASAIGARYAAVRRSLNERGRRRFAAAEARTAGHGGISASACATGVARSTIGRGLKDLDSGRGGERSSDDHPGGHRAPGGGIVLAMPFDWVSSGAIFRLASTCDQEYQPDQRFAPGSLRLPGDISKFAIRVRQQNSLSSMVCDRRTTITKSTGPERTGCQRAVFGGRSVPRCQQLSPKPAGFLGISGRYLAAESEL